MSRSFIGLSCAVLILIFGVSCRHTQPEGKDLAVPEATPVQLKIRQQLDTVTLLLQQGKGSEAEALLDAIPLDYYGDEHLQLSELIRQRRVVDAKSLPAKVTGQTALQQVADRLRLPESHGRTVTITKDEIPVELPPGPMEQLINRKVTMNLEKAPVRDMIMELSKIDGLNIISDQKLIPDEGAAPGEDAGPKLTIQVKDVPLKEVLSYIARNLGLTFHLGENVIWVTAAAEPASDKGPEMETRIIPLRRGLLPGGSGSSGGGGGEGGAPDGGAAAPSGADDDELLQALDTFLADGPTGTTFKLYPNRNLLVVRTSLEKLRLVEQLVKEFDIHPQQVLIEARFLTIGEKALKDLGSNLQQLTYTNPATKLKNIPGLNITKDPTTGVITTTPNPRQIFDAAVQSGVFGNTISPALGTPGSMNTVGLGGVLGNVEYSYILRALEEQSSTKTLSAPRVTVTNNHSASIHKGENLYYWKEWESDVSYTPNGNNNTSTQTALPRPSGPPTEVKLGLQLDVRVNIGNDGQTVMLALKPAITALKGFNTYGTGQDPTAAPAQNNNNNNNQNNGTQVTGYQLPVITDNSVSTAAVVKSGETIVLGGVLEDTDQEKIEKTPVLGDLPLLGWFFKHKSKNKEPQHLLIFVTATVVAPSGEFVETRTVAPAAAPEMAPVPLK